jgi:stage II sporulation protein D
MRGRATGRSLIFALLFFYLAALPAGLNLRRLPEMRPEPGRRTGLPEPVVQLYEEGRAEPRLLPIETYLAGVVAAEMDDRFPPEALAAQAIAARTYTLYQIERGRRPTARVETFQAYDERRVTLTVAAAVERTRGLVLIHEGALAAAYYHACAGGSTATAAEAFGADHRPYLHPLPEEPCGAADRWRAEFPAAELARASGVTLPLHSVRIGETGPSGRAITLTINGKEVTAVRIRAALGPTRMRSTMLTRLELKEGAVVMEGRGYGHGAGLSQWGALAMAERGAMAEQILARYYPGTELEKRWD